MYVLTPVQCHLAQIKAVLGAGKAVFTEKPAAMSVASVQDIKGVCGSGGRVMVGYMKRHESNLLALQKLRRERDWGRLQFIRMHSFIGRHWNAAINDLVPVISSSKEIGFDLSQDGFTKRLSLIGYCVGFNSFFTSDSLSVISNCKSIWIV